MSLFTNIETTTITQESQEPQIQAGAGQFSTINATSSAGSTAAALIEAQDKRIERATNILQAIAAIIAIIYFINSFIKK